MHSGPVARVAMALRFAKPWQRIVILAAAAGGGVLLLAHGRPLPGALLLAFAVLAGGSAGRDLIRRPAREVTGAPGDGEAGQSGQAGGARDPEGGG